MIYIFFLINSSSNLTVLCKCHGPVAEYIYIIIYFSPLLIKIGVFTLSRQENFIYYNHE